MNFEYYKRHIVLHFLDYTLSMGLYTKTLFTLRKWIAKGWVSHTCNCGSNWTFYARFSSNIVNFLPIGAIRRFTLSLASMFHEIMRVCDCVGQVSNSYN